VAPHPLVRSFIAAARAYKNMPKTAPAAVPHEAELV
jgi:hypothetical protein